MEIEGNLVLADATLPGSLLNAQRTTIKGVLMCNRLRSKDTHVNLMGVSASVSPTTETAGPNPAGFT
jgi:hypothetical protein